jgi:RNA-binding protein
MIARRKRTAIVRGDGRPAKTTATPTPTPGPKRKKRIARSKVAAKTQTEEEKAATQAARALSGRAARYLRGLGHHLEPIVQIGKEGITEGVVAATRAALLAHELIKVKISQDAPIDRKVAGTELADRAGAALAQTLGRTALLYKRHPHKPKIELPR